MAAVKNVLIYLTHWLTNERMKASEATAEAAADSTASTALRSSSLLLSHSLQGAINYSRARKKRSSQTACQPANQLASHHTSQTLGEVGNKANYCQAKLPQPSGSTQRQSVSAFGAHTQTHTVSYSRLLIDQAKHSCCSNIGISRLPIINLACQSNSHMRRQQWNEFFNHLV